MDPLSALGIAANVFTVVGFASKMVTLVDQIGKTGDSLNSPVGASRRLARIVRIFRKTKHFSS
jgi:hypothetical protein